MRKRLRLSQSWILGTLTVLAAVSSPGCGSGPKPFPVLGTILFEDGSPANELAGGTVTFTSDEMKVSASGDIYDDGTFRLTTHKKDDGAFPGKYRVAVAAPEPDISERARRPRDDYIIDLRYENPQTSGLEFVIEAKSNEITFKLPRYSPGRR